MVNEKIKAAEENLIHVYNRFPIALERGEGVYLYDTNGKKYLDFAAGFAVSGLGYGNQKLNAALKFQIDQLYHTSNLYYHTNCGEAAQKLNRISGMDRVFFTNSGSEANEGALKRQDDMRIIKNRADISLSPWKIRSTGAASAPFP